MHGYIPKSLPSSEIAAAIKGVIEGRIFVPAAIGKRGPGGARPEAPGANNASDKLTMRQKEVLNELLKGQSSKEIARSLGIAEGTVKIHLAAIYRALGVRTRAEAIVKLKPQ